MSFFQGITRYLPIMRNRALRSFPANGATIEHQWLLTVHGQPAAMTVFKYIANRNCGLGLDIAVHPAFRKVRYGEYSTLSALITALRLEQLQADAQAADRPPPLGMVVEVESARLFASFQRRGLIELPVEYYEPPFVCGPDSWLDEEEAASIGFQPMHLGIYPIPGGGFEQTNQAMLADCVLALLVDHYGLPGDHWVVNRALSSIFRQETLDQTGHD